jgi:dTDP-4-amino-4,6-dideoxygalactose transaminase
MAVPLLDLNAQNLALETELKAAFERVLRCGVPLHQQECFAYLKTPRESLPVANRLADEVLSIPIFPELKREQLDEVVTAIRGFTG